MSELIKVAQLTELPIGAVKVVQIADREIALFNLEGRIYAIDNLCPHRGGPLHEGSIEGCEVICPWHGWRFNITNGSNNTLPNKPVQSFEVKIEGNDIFLQV